MDFRSRLYEHVGENLSILAHRKWMWGGPGETIQCASTKKQWLFSATQRQPSCLFLWARLYLCMCVFVCVSVCVSEAHSQRVFIIWADFFLRQKPVWEWVFLFLVTSALVRKSAGTWWFPGLLRLLVWRETLLDSHQVLVLERKQRNAPFCYNNPCTRALKCLTNGEHEGETERSDVMIFAP